MKIPEKIRREMDAFPVFYRRVWIACARIPRGQTRTYRWIARQIGSPRAARAVGQALAKNPFAPVIPCHRVVGSDGRLTGYSGRGGLKTKQHLLDLESAQTKR